MTYVYKRGKTWAVRYSKRATVWDPKLQKEVSKLKQKQKGGFKTKVEAKNYGIKMESAALSGVDVVKNPVFSVSALSCVIKFSVTVGVKFYT